MHLNRAELTKKIPVPRKGTKYVVRALNNVSEGVPVLIAIRDILGLAKDAREVKSMIHNKLIKINGNVVKDYREPVKIFGILDAGNRYVLTIKETGRFAFEETKQDYRLAKILNKKMVKNKTIQLNLHDGTNINYSKEAFVGDTVKLGFDNKIKEILHPKKGNSVFIFSGKNLGKHGKIKEMENKKYTLILEDKEVQIDQSHLIIA